MSAPRSFTGKKWGEWYSIDQTFSRLHRPHAQFRYEDASAHQTHHPKSQCKLATRVIACLDVRANDNGDLVVTKGDCYDVREKSGEGDVRNVGKPVRIRRAILQGGADEIAFLNITSFTN